MRNLILLIVFCLGGYWLYQRYLVPGALPPEPGSGPAPALVDASAQTGSLASGFAVPDPAAWKEVSSYSSKPGKVFVIVTLSEGNRWRAEARAFPTMRTVVNIFDGVTFVSSPPGFTKGTPPSPVSGLRNLLSQFNLAKPVGTGQRDGRECWQYKENTPVERADGWIDKETHFPVAIEGWSQQAGTMNIHYQLLKADFSILRATCFDTANVAPMLTPFLNP